MPHCSAQCFLRGSTIGPLFGENSPATIVTAATVSELTLRIQAGAPLLNQEPVVPQLRRWRGWDSTWENPTLKPLNPETEARTLNLGRV